MKKREQLHAKNLVEILIGLAEAEVLPESAKIFGSEKGLLILDEFACVCLLRLSSIWSIMEMDFDRSDLHSLYKANFSQQQT